MILRDFNFPGDVVLTFITFRQSAEALAKEERLTFRRFAVILEESLHQKRQRSMAGKRPENSSIGQVRKSDRNSP